MAPHKRPELKLDGNVSENFKNFDLRFNDYCIQSDYRDLDKDPDNEKAQHYKKPLLEISTLRSAMPDEALQIIRYTIEPSIRQADKKKPWVWMDKLRTHYTGTAGSTIMTDRFKFWHSSQNQNETVQDWEIQIRQAGSLCEYGQLTDIMCRDKFVFGLCDNTIRTELLKTHLKPDGSPKTMAEVVAEAKSMESAQRTNKLISDTSKGIEDPVNWTDKSKPNNTRKKHRDMKLKRDPNTCYWCGDPKGPHRWTACPANGRTCMKCNGYDHFARVCLEQPTTLQHNSQKYNRSSRGRTGSSQQTGSNFNNRQIHSIQTNNQYDISSTAEPNQSIGQPIYYADNEQPQYYYSTIYAVEQKNNQNKGDKYFSTLPCSSTGNKFTNLKFQIDSAATCNTISHEVVQKHFPDIKIQISCYLLHPYGDSKPIKPIGQIKLLCEKYKKYHALPFQVLPSNIMSGKPSLLSGRDSVKMEIITINADNVYALQQQSTASPTSTTAPNTKRTPLRTNTPITRQSFLEHYKDNFNGVGLLLPPVSFKVNSEITPIQMPIHRVPLSKRDKEKEAIERYVHEGILEKANEPSSWCSNILCRETPN